MLIIFLVIALLALSYVLSRATDFLVSGLTQLSDGTNFEASGLTTLFVALATSLPELFIGIASALEGNQSLSLGVAMGSNIANVSLVIGGAALVSGSVKATGFILRKDLVYTFLISCLPLLLLMDGVLSRIDGVVLLAVYLLFNISILTGSGRKQLEEVEREYYDKKGLRHRVLNFLGRKDTEQGLGKMVVGSILLVVCADLIVRLSGYIATVVNIPVLLVGLFLVSVGATLPELAFEIKTVKNKEYLLTFGNLIGSVVVNSSLILGAVSILSPIVVLKSAMQSYFISVIAFLVLFTLFWLMSYSKKRLDRWEGVVLLVVYFGFIGLQMWVS